MSESCVNNDYLFVLRRGFVWELGSIGFKLSSPPPHPRLPVCVFLHLPVCVSLHFPVCLSLHLPVCLFLHLAIIHHVSGENKMKRFIILRHYEYEPGSRIMSEAGSAPLLNIPASSIDVDYKKVNKEILKGGSSSFF